MSRQDILVYGRVGDALRHHAALVRAFPCLLHIQRHYLRDTEQIRNIQEQYRPNIQVIIQWVLFKGKLNMVIFGEEMLQNIGVGISHL